AVAIHEREVVVQARQDDVRAALLRALAVVAVHERDEARDGRIEIAADGAEEVRRAAHGLERARELLELPPDVPRAAPRESERGPVPADDAEVREHVALKVGERVPVAEDLGTRGVAPDEVERLELSLQEERGGPGQGERSRQAPVGPDEVHAV